MTITSFWLSCLVMGEVEIRYRYRLRTNTAPRHALQEMFDTCWFCWNQALRRWGNLWAPRG